MDGKATAHLEFVDSHARSPSHFPLLKVIDKPDLLGVPYAQQFRTKNGRYMRVPLHCIETLAEVKADSTHGRAQAASYAYRHQQARPDHPAFLCLSVKPQYYQIVLSEPCGVVASPRFPWSELGALVSFFHTIYVGSNNRILHDSTVFWKSVAKNPAASIVTFNVSWSVECGGELYTEGSMICDFGDAWGRRTTVFAVTDPSGQHAIIKEYYWHHKRRFEESNLLASVHADGDVPGVVRMICYEDVVVDGRRIECGVEGDTLRIKKRIVLYDYGYSLLTARSVNELLRAFYDALEGTCSSQMVSTEAYNPRSASYLAEERDHAPRHEHQQHFDSPGLAGLAWETRDEGPSTAD